MLQNTLFSCQVILANFASDVFLDRKINTISGYIRTFILPGKSTREFLIQKVLHSRIKPKIIPSRIKPFLQYIVIKRKSTLNGCK